MGPSCRPETASSRDSQLRRVCPGAGSRARVTLDLRERPGWSDSRDPCAPRTLENMGPTILTLRGRKETPVGTSLPRLEQDPSNCESAA